MIRVALNFSLLHMYYTNTHITAVRQFVCDEVWQFIRAESAIHLIYIHICTGIAGQLQQDDLQWHHFRHLCLSQHLVLSIYQREHQPPPRLHVSRQRLILHASVQGCDGHGKQQLELGDAPVP